jgi:hypothetical protein
MDAHPLDEAARRAADSARSRDNEAEAQTRALRELLDLPAGRRVVWRLLERAGLFRQSFTGEPLSSAFNEGRRALGLEMLAEIAEAAPDAYPALLREFGEKRE